MLSASLNKNIFFLPSSRFDLICVRKNSFFSRLAYYNSLCHVRSLTFKFLNYTMVNECNNPLGTQNYRLSVPREINVASHELKLTN